MFPPGCRRTTSCGSGSMWGSTGLRWPACVCVGRRFLGQGAGAVYPRRARRLAFPSEHTAELERSAAANALVGVAYDPSRTSPHARNDPLRLPVAIGDESGARRRRLPSAACGRGMSVTCRKRCPRERHRRGGESVHVASSFDVGFSNFEFDGLKPSSTPFSIVLSDHMPAGSTD